MKLSATIYVIIKILETDITMGITVCSTFQTIPKTAHQFGMKDHAKIVASGILFVAKSFRGIGLAVQKVDVRSSTGNRVRIWR